MSDLSVAAGDHEFLSDGMSDFELHDSHHAGAEPDDRWHAPEVEHALRRRRLSRIGLFLILGFSLPILGMPGEPISFQQFRAFPGFNLAGVALFLPLIAGLAVVFGARLVAPPMRGAILLVAGVSPLLVVLAIDGGASMLMAGAGEIPTALVVTIGLLVAASMLLLVSSRVRRYRPLLRSSYWAGVVGCVCYVAHLLVPVAGRMPILELATIWKQSLVLGIGFTAHVALLAAACLVTLCNGPAQPTRSASRRAALASRLLVAAAMALLLAVASSMFLELVRGLASGLGAGAAAMVLSTVVNAALMIAGFVLLLPAAIADLWIGRS